VRGEFWTTMVYLAFVGLGLSLIYILRRPLLDFLSAALTNDSSITVHEFIARRHGNDPRVRAVAALLTVFAVSGLITCAMLGLETMLHPLLSGSVGLTKLFIAVLFLVVITCTISFGHTGIMHSSQLQLGLLYFGLFGSTVCLLYLQVSELGAIPVQGSFAIAFIAVVSAVIYFRRRVRYVDTSSLRHIVIDGAVVVRDHDPLPLRLLSRFQKILNCWNRCLLRYARCRIFYIRRLLRLLVWRLHFAGTWTVFPNAAKSRSISKFRLILTACQTIGNWQYFGLCRNV